MFAFLYSIYRMQNIFIRLIINRNFFNIFCKNNLIKDCPVIQRRQGRCIAALSSAAVYTITLITDMEPAVPITAGNNICAVILLIWYKETNHGKFHNYYNSNSYYCYCFQLYNKTLCITRRVLRHGQHQTQKEEAFKNHLYKNFFYRRYAL